jgi:malonate transporter
MTSFHPLLIILSTIIIGLFCGRKKIVTTAQINGFEIVLFKVLLPCYLFTATLNYELETLINKTYILSYLTTFIIIGFLCVILFYQDRISNISIKILSAGYINAAIYSLPIITFFLEDPKAGILGNLVQVIIIQSFFIMLLSLINHKERSIFKRLTTILTNPLVVMPIVGLLCNYFSIELHAVLIKTLANIGSGAPSIALFTFGLTLSTIELRSIRITNKELLSLIFIKNFLHPITAFLVGKFIFELSHYWLNSLIIASSAPTAFVVYLIAKQYNLKESLVKNTVAITSVISIFSLIFISFLI